MALTSSEYEILTQALRLLKGETGLTFELQQKEPTNEAFDCLLKAPHQTQLIPTEIKRNIRAANVGAIIHQIKSLQPTGLLVADYINPNIAKTLKENKIQYLDACGNGYLDLPPIYINVIGQKPALVMTKKTNGAFDLSGLKIIYGFLCNNLLVNASYREIAQQTGIALGMVGKILNYLKDTEFLLDQGNGKERRLVNRHKLLARWVEAYPEKLKPKLFVGEFVSDKANWWKDINIQAVGGYWSGEVAAAKYTNYLSPQTITVYLPEQAGNKLLVNARLRKAEKLHSENVVKVYRPFWPEKYNSYYLSVDKNMVHPILIYADLIASADSRNLETARMLYDSTIAEYIGED